MSMFFEKLSETAQAPTYSSEGAAGADLFSDEEVKIPPGERRLIKTNIALEIPSGYYGRIAPRSGLANKFGIDVLAGVIDSDYRNGIGVILLNTGNVEFSVNKGDRIAQIIFERCFWTSFSEGSLSDTRRGKNGFGSTGV